MHMQVQNMLTCNLLKIILGFVRKLVQEFAKASLKHVILRKQ